MWGILIALVSGALMSIQGVFNTGVTKQTSTWVAAGFVQFTAFLVCLIAWVITGREGSFVSLFRIDSKYMLVGGVFGAFITYTVIQSMNSLGPARSVMFIVTAQLLTAYIIELFGFFQVEKVHFELRKLIGFVVIIIGIITYKWK